MSLTSADPFYSTVDPSSPQQEDVVKRMTTRQSKRLPGWAWLVLAKCLGIKLHPTDRPYLGTALYSLTIALAALYAITYTWYTIYDIANEYTKSTVLTGLAAIIIVVYWASLGVYGNRLASKLFASESFLRSVRMHSRTLFRLNAVAIMVLVSLGANILNNYDAATTYTADKCLSVNVSQHICITMVAARGGYSFACFMWSILVGIVLLSVCRTHTIGWYTCMLSIIYHYI